ncbi:XF1762 family protein [Roseivivax sp. CAU 1761]
MAFDAASAEVDVCPWCGQASFAELHEAWGHEFAGDPKDAAEILRQMGADVLLGCAIRGVSSETPSLLLDFRLSVRPVRFAVAKEFVRRHHAHCRPPAGWKFGLGCWNGPSLIGVAMVGRPVARMIDATQVLEVNRLCLDRSMPSAHRFNASSMLYGWAAREARRRGYSKIITYTLSSESGASLRASGWAEEDRSRGGGWSRPSRGRSNPTPTEPKVRWARVLRSA